MAIFKNPLRGASSIGKGIALQNKFQNDYSGNRVVEEAFARKPFGATKKKDELFSPLDVNVDYTKIEPYWAEKIQKEVSNWANEYAQAKSINKDNAFAMVQPNYAQAQSRIAGWIQSNDEFKKYKSQGEGAYKNTDLISKVRTPGVKDEEVFSFNDKIGNVTFTEDGMFSFAPVKIFDEPVDFKENEYTELPFERSPSPFPGKMVSKTGKMVLPDAYQNKIESLAMRPDFQASVIMEFPELRKADEKTKREKYLEVSKMYVDKKMPPVKYDYGLVDVDTSGGSRSGSDKDKREKPVIVKDTKQTLLTPTGETEEVKDPYNKVTTKAKKDNVESNILLSASVAKTPAITIPMDSRVIDATTNEYFIGDDLNQAVTFKPDNVYTEAIKKSGKWEKYVLGTATVNKVDRKGVKTEKIITLKVPYDKVQSSIEGAYDLSEFDSQFEELRKIPVKEVKSNTTTKTVIAPNNSVGVKPEI